MASSILPLTTPLMTNGGKKVGGREGRRWVGSLGAGRLACRLSCRSHDGWGKKPTAGPTALSSEPKAADLDPECSFLPPQLHLLPPSRHPLPDPQRPEHRPCQPFPVTAFVFFHFPSSSLYWILGQANHTSLDQKVRTPTYSMSLRLVIHQKVTCPTRCWNWGPLGSRRSMSVWRANSLRAFQGGWYPWMSTGFKGPSGDSWRTAIEAGQIRIF